MKKYLLLFVIFYSPICFGTNTYLSCNVGGKGTMSTGYQTNIPIKKITVEIVEVSKNKIITVDGEVEYTLSVDTVNNVSSPLIKKVFDYSDENRYDITNMIEDPNSEIVIKQTFKITINRFTGLISYSKSQSFKDGVYVQRSFSGSCEKVSNKKF